jgi:hypothetical protein
MICGMRNIFQRREFRQQIMELVDEADVSGGVGKRALFVIQIRDIAQADIIDADASAVGVSRRPMSCSKVDFPDAALAPPERRFLRPRSPATKRHLEWSDLHRLDDRFW